ncbi:AAA family ATPase, partial [Lachnospiraceae bacterium 48-21]
MDCGIEGDRVLRPRRFGKTLNLSTLRYFFEDTGHEKRNEQNKSLFQGMK